VRDDHRRRSVAAAVLGLGLLGTVAACGLPFGSDEPGPAPTPVTFSFDVPEDERVLLAAGDVADCDEDGDELTAELLDDLEGVIVPLGDVVYEDGTPQEFAECYEPTWGRHKDRTLPVIGNHEYETGDADAYFDYFGAAAGDPAKGYHSLDIGPWHVIILNSNCGQVGECEEGSPQYKWLVDDLAASDARCTVAMWHNPLFSSGRHGGNDKVEDWWTALYDAGADLVLNAHDHNYERFAPQDPSGSPDPDYGITQFVVGTGGGTLRDMERPIRNSEAREDNTYGVLELTLEEDGAAWEFKPADGSAFDDSGTLDCHDAPPKQD
jgi:hypothetical protein